MGSAVDKAAPAVGAGADEQTSFEQAFAELQKLVQTIEGGKLTLDDSIAAFEKGVRMAAYCRKRLEEAEGKILQLTKDNKLVDMEPPDGASHA